MYLKQQNIEILKQELKPPVQIRIYLSKIGETGCGCRMNEATNLYSESAEDDLLRRVVCVDLSI